MTFVKLLRLLIGWFSFTSNMARMKLTPWKGEGRKTLRVRTQTEVHAVPKPVEEAPPTPGEIERRKVGAEKLEKVGRLLESSPTQQLAQVAAEARQSMSGREEPARRKL